MSTIRKCAGRESFQRMNYLFQLCNEQATENAAAHIASLQYSNLMVSISKKAVLRLDIDVKRMICKRCRSILVPGITCRIRIKKKKIIKHCLKCAQFKVFDTKNRDYSPWTQTKESVVELLTQTPNQSVARKNEDQSKEQ